MSDLARRVITALVLLPVVIGAVVFGGWAFAALVALGAGIAQWELYGLGEAGGVRPLKPLGVAAGVLAVLAAVWAPALPLAIIALLALIAAELYRRQPAPLASAALGGFGVLYPSALVASFVFIRVGAAPEVGEAGAAWLTVAAFVSVWAADTFAYFTGRAIGRRKLFERVSPKKTIEGTVGGVIGAVAALLLMQWLVLPFLAPVHAAMIGFIAGVAGPFGDLTASLFKRAVGVKDSGKLLPGHGGLLDRIDALIFAGPLIAIYLVYVARLF
jgi:phosphatidate cytidylyltransferase